MQPHATVKGYFKNGSDNGKKGKQRNATGGGAKTIKEYHHVSTESVEGIPTPHYMRLLVVT